MCKDNRKPTLEVLLVVAVAALLHPATERSRAETTTPGLQQTDEPLQRFQAAHPATATSRDRDGGITRVFGKAFGGGRSPAAAAERAVNVHGASFCARLLKTQDKTRFAVGTFGPTDWPRVRLSVKAFHVRAQRPGHGKLRKRL